LENIIISEDYYALVKSTYSGYEIIPDDFDGEMNAFATAEEAFAAIEASEEAWDLEVAKIQILRKKGS
jgi:hypothetical protein